MKGQSVRLWPPPLFFSVKVYHTQNYMQHLTKERAVLGPALQSPVLREQATGTWSAEDVTRVLVGSLARLLATRR